LGDYRGLLLVKGFASVICRGLLLVKGFAGDYFRGLAKIKGFSRGAIIEDRLK
jgi:hypothetical protein